MTAADLRAKILRLTTEIQQLRNEKEQLRTAQEQLRTKNEQLRTKQRETLILELQLRDGPRPGPLTPPNNVTPGKYFHVFY